LSNENSNFVSLKILGYGMTDVPFRVREETGLQLVLQAVVWWSRIYMCL